MFVGDISSKIERNMREKGKNYLEELLLGLMRKDIEHLSVAKCEQNKFQGILLMMRGHLLWR